MSTPARIALRTAVAARSTLGQTPTLALQSRRSAVGLLSMKLYNPHHQQRLLGSLPTIAQSSFWKSLIPKPLRRGNNDSGGASPIAKAAARVRSSKEWNPATFYIFFFLFIGSMAIQMIALKRDFNTFMRQSEVKIGILKEVVERIQKGENVDVERILGTGDPAQEAEWEAVLKEIQRDEPSRTARRQDKVTAGAAPAASPAAPTSDKATPGTPATSEGASTEKVASITSFY